MHKTKHRQLAILVVLAMPVLLFALEPPVPTSPLPGSKGTNTKVELMVDCTGPVEMLHFQLFNSGIGGDDPIAEVYTPYYSWLCPEENSIHSPLPAELQPGEYYWTCRCRYADIWSDFFTPRWNFEVTKDEPPLKYSFLEPPVPISPLPGAKGTNTKVELVVDCTVETEMLHFQLFSGTGESAVPLAEVYTLDYSWLAPEGNIRSQQHGVLEPGIYHWTCRARYGGIWSDFFTPRWDFEVTKDEPPLEHSFLEPPVPISPLPGSKSTNTKPELIVDCPSEIQMLHFRLFSQAGDGTGPIAEVFTPNRSWVVPEGNLINSPLPAELQLGEYYWTCRCRYADVWSGFFTPLWNFEVIKDGPSDAALKPPPDAPIPVAPPSGSKIIEFPITLEVDAPAGTELFHFQVKRSGADITEPVFETYTHERFWSLPLMPPVEPNVYEWSCRLYDGEVWSHWFSPWWTFEIEKPDEGMQGNPDRVSSDNTVRPRAEPNPCGPNGTRVYLSLSPGVQASAAVYTPPGRLVKRRTSRQGSGGRGQESGVRGLLFWDGTDQTGIQVGTGTYLCCISSDDARHVVKIVKSR